VARVGSSLASKGSAAVVAETETEIVEGIGSDYAAKYGFSNSDEAGDYFFKSGRGISHEVVEAIAEHKNEPSWMRKVRHRALDYFFARPLPTWGGDLSGIDFDNIYYGTRTRDLRRDSPLQGSRRSTTNYLKLAVLQGLLSSELQSYCVAA